mmetsp:Transcript_81217/g.156876  ORF Transcript_81217/g.156876 Transcript_81217/m.156876 type:complete len:98 (+) Transcript_81217:230-523(+)
MAKTNVKTSASCGATIVSLEALKSIQQSYAYIRLRICKLFERFYCLEEYHLNQCRNLWTGRSDESLDVSVQGRSLAKKLGVSLRFLLVFADCTSSNG